MFSVGFYKLIGINCKNDFYVNPLRTSPFLLKIENPIESVKDETIDYNVDHAYLLEKDNYSNFIINDSFVRNGGFEHSSDSLYWDIADWSVSQGRLLKLANENY